MAQYEKYAQSSWRIRNSGVLKNSTLQLEMPGQLNKENMLVLPLFLLI